MDQPVETQSLEGAFFNPTSLSFSSSFSSVQNSILPNQNWTFLFRRSSRPRATDPREAGDDDAAQAPRRRSNRRGARRYSARGRPKVLPVWNTGLPAYSDTLGNIQNGHYKRSVTVSVHFNYKVDPFAVEKTVTVAEESL